MHTVKKETVALDFTSLQGHPPGTISGMLKRSYAEIIASDPSLWEPEIRGWEEYDREIFRYPETVGNCLFLSWADNALVGFGSFDPRPAPQFGIIGHHCILPEFSSSGYGRQQLLEILRRIQTLKIDKARVSTLDHPFFEPARRLYESLGFHKTGLKEWHSNTAPLNIIEFEARVYETLKQKV